MNMVWRDEASPFGDITGVISERTEALDRISTQLLGYPYYWNLLRVGRGYGKRAMQRAMLERMERNPLTAVRARPIPGVEVEKIRWRCAPPTGRRGFASIFQQLEETFTMQFAERSGFAARMEAQLAARINKPGVDVKVHDVSHNVNVVTDRVPPHIAALPEEEQGPALVEAIFERKRRAQSVSDSDNA